MQRTWRQVWEGRRLDAALPSVLAQLMAADGLDSGFGNVAEEAWRNYVRRTAGVMGIQPTASVFEIGCGAGAYLYELYREGCVVSGLDGSGALIGYARQAMPQGNWQQADASAFRASQSYDYVVASGVFFYFPSLHYARLVLEKMARSARRGVMVLDVPDVAKREEAMTMRRGSMGVEAYEEKYGGLDHLYFEKSWFERALGDLGMKAVRVEDQYIDGYGNSAYRFNVFAWA